MQFTIIALASLIAAVSAQNGVPTCAAGCVKELPSECATQDIACICGDSSFITNVSCCVSKSCAQSDQAAALQFALNICQAGGVTLTNTAATCLSTATSSASSSTSSSSASTSSSATTPSIVNPGTSHSSSATTAPSTTASTTASTSGATVGAGSGSMTMASTSTSGTSTSAGTSSTGSSSGTSTSTGTAPKITAMAGFFGAAAAAVALL